MLHVSEIAILVLASLWLVEGQGQVQGQEVKVADS